MFQRRESCRRVDSCRSRRGSRTSLEPSWRTGRQWTRLRRREGVDQVCALASVSRSNLFHHHLMILVLLYLLALESILTSFEVRSSFRCSCDSVKNQFEQKINHLIQLSLSKSLKHTVAAFKNCQSVQKEWHKLFFAIQNSNSIFCRGKEAP